MMNWWHAVFVDESLEKDLLNGTKTCARTLNPSQKEMSLKFDPLTRTNGGDRPSIRSDETSF